MVATAIDSLSDSIQMYQTLFNTTSTGSFAWGVSQAGRDVGGEEGQAGLGGGVGAGQGPHRQLYMERHGGECGVFVVCTVQNTL